MKDFLGTSLAFPIRPDGNGGLALVSGEDAVDDSIKAIILTQKGSHLMEPWLGWDIAVFSHVTNLYVIAAKIKEAIIAGEDRVDPDKLFVEVTLDEGTGELQVAISRTIIGAYTSRTLQFGFRDLD